jgi:hypothetical protein
MEDKIPVEFEYQGKTYKGWLEKQRSKLKQRRRGMDYNVVMKDGKKTHICFSPKPM